MAAVAGWPRRRYGSSCRLAPAVTNPLNDTGIDSYSDDSHNGLTSEPATHPRQDARIGRDAQAKAGQLSKIGGGGKGFDFTKIASDGNSLPESATLGSDAGGWACTDRQARRLD